MAFFIRDTIADCSGVSAIEVSRSQGLRADADFKKLTDFRISTIKPLLPKWLHRAWLRVADDREMVKRGWKKCGLRAPFDETKDDVLKKALQAITDPDHYLFPLFPNSDRTLLPPEVLRGEVEPEKGQAGEPWPDVAVGEAKDAEDEETVQRVIGQWNPNRACSQGRANISTSTNSRRAV
jgi:hypothetical protein